MKKRQRQTQPRITGSLTTTRKMTTFATLGRIAYCFRVTSNPQSPARANRRHAPKDAAQISVISLMSSPSSLRLWLLLFSIALHLVASVTAVGYSYTRFEGPVAGPEHQVTVPHAFGGGSRVDYVGRPEYSFAYGVEDGKTRVLQNRKETRNGDEVRGVYSVVDPDGTLRVVKYTADDVHGFQAEVITNGVATLHGHEGGEGAGGGGGGGSDIGAAGAVVEHEVEHDEENKVQDSAKGNYKVHEDYDEGKKDEGEGAGDGEEGEEGDDEEGDHAEYEGSSEEGYEDANPHSQQQETSSEEEY
ncbi:uncharacterized protein LOC115622514 [Scaptodrosophila lebanonensis]|uniref:Uncharacterized protein LOC115622514 n=1 Tax=Drosophila lebanonensis TaxID=7225 RepID=A0A6J2TB52_DROLE|nr:uncharacterized protein LOC115622514 [Scaptodrosophila lebanonensis]